MDRDIDASTGLTLTSRDVSGLSSSHRYDSLGRLTEWNGPARYDAGHGKAAAKPASGPWIQYCYRPAVAPWIPAAVETSWWGDMDIRFGCGQVSDAPLRRTSVDVEGFGRPWREYRTIFDGTRAQRITEYTSMGSRKSVTEWQPELPSVERKTWYQNYDPFGRPGRVLPPDGSPHDTTFTYAGIRLRSRTVSVATAVGMESSATTTEELDPYGRLARVTEPSGPAGTNTTTAYAYDVGGRLREASTTSGSTTQTRRFVFDNRGFLTSEQLPEAGTFGNGLVLYSRRDARGYARRIQDGAHDVAFTYDAAERLVQVAQADAQGGPGTPVLETFGFGTANAPGNVKLGKLETAFSGNPDVAGASVSETYTYGGPGGRISARRTEVGGRTIDQGFSLGDYGEVLSLSYPDDLAIAAGEDPPRALTMSYGFGALTAVEPYAWYVSYHPNGLVKEVLHSNGMKDLFEKDPYDLPRVASIALQRSADGFVFGSLGPYAYDGLGNVRSIGADWFTYDPVGRLTNGTVSSGSYRQCAAYNAFGSVVGLGTGVPSCTPSPIAVDEATNRLASPVTYDAAGNVTSWGGHTYEWSRLNRMWRTTGAGINESYAYTASGERILERNALDGTETLSIRDLDGKVLREYGRSPSGQWSWTKDYVYRDGTILASMTPSETRHFHVDHLGSVRAATSSAIPPTPIPDTVRDYYPFGLDVFGASDPERMRFAGHQRDTQGTLGQTDDLDYMHARHYSPLLGRFLSIDPGRDQDPAAPQSWNLYAYARNNPLKYVDPDGMEPKKPYVTLTFNQRELPTRAQTLEFFQRSINDPFSISLSRARLETPTIFEGDSATAANFEKGLRDSDGLSVFVGHAVVLGTGGLVFSDKQSMLKEVTNNNGIVCLAACDTSRLAGKLGITDKTVGRAFVGTIGSPNSLDLANLAARFLSLINGGNSVGDAVKSLNRDLAGDKKLYRLAVTGDGKVRVEK